MTFEMTITHKPTAAATMKTAINIATLGLHNAFY